MEGAKRFYGAVFGWEFDPVDFGGGPMAMVRVPGYGDYLESIDPGVRKRHADGGAPPGFTDCGRVVRSGRATTRRPTGA